MQKPVERIARCRDKGVAVFTARPRMPPPPSNRALASSVQAPCRIRFGAPQAVIRWADLDAALHVALPLLGGVEAHELLSDASPAVVRDGCTICQQGHRLAGFTVAPASLDLEAATRELYRRLFAVTGDLALIRIWNYVPQINAVPDGLENYRHFCRGRSLAFEDRFGAHFQRHLPAASAVGAPAGPLALAFLAGHEPVRHFENPAQVPAFEYPLLYGPRSPSFSRATLAGTQLFISGTAAIRGHQTIAIGDLAGQLACTHENLQRIAETAGAGASLGANNAWHRAFNVYVRRDTDLLQVKNYLERHVLSARDDVTYLQADLCRAELLVEIEAVLTR
jgi:chorismate lyase/3-hydroxybenzoate synthase